MTRNNISSAFSSRHYIKASAFESLEQLGILIHKEEGHKLLVPTRFYQTVCVARAYRLSFNDTKPLPFTCLPNGCSNASETGAVDPRCLWLHRGDGDGLIVFGHLFKKQGWFPWLLNGVLSKHCQICFITLHHYYCHA